MVVHRHRWAEANTFHYRLGALLIYSQAKRAEMADYRSGRYQFKGMKHRFLASHFQFQSMSEGQCLGDAPQ